MRNKKLLSISTACMLVLSVPALADICPETSGMYGPGRMGGYISTDTSDTFAMLDRNQNDVLTMDEYNNRINRVGFGTVDANRDGALSRMEFNSYKPERAGMKIGLGSFRELDADGNDRVTRSEFRADRSNVSFNAVDKNKNGIISRRELDSYMDRHPDMR